MTLRWPIAAGLGLLPVALVATVAVALPHHAALARPTHLNGAAWQAEQTVHRLSAGTGGAASDTLRSACASLPSAGRGAVAGRIAQGCYLEADMLEALEHVHGCAGGPRGNVLRACLTAGLRWFSAAVRSETSNDAAIATTLARTGTVRAHAPPPPPPPPPAPPARAPRPHRAPPAAAHAPPP